MDVIEQQDTEVDSASPPNPAPARPLRNPPCWPVRPHIQRGNSLYCASCGRLIMTLHP